MYLKMKSIKKYLNIVLFLVVSFGYAQTPDYILQDPTNRVKLEYSKIKTSKKDSVFHENKLAQKSTSKETRRPDGDCLIDLTTGECITIDPIDPPGGGGGVTSSPYVGATQDDFTVSLGGAANYKVPFMLPPGIKDVAPNVGLAYSSQANNGLAGYGWNISGLSTITRVPSTKYHDNEIDGIDFDNKDRYALDGQRLMLKSGTYGGANSQYQTENYTNLKIVAYGTSPYGSSYGPSYFIVYHPNGLRAYYGNGGNSRGRLEWALYKTIDPQGNYVQYDYLQSNNLLRINTIKYGARNSASSPNEIKFFYKTRTRREISYIGSYTFIRSNILDRVEIRGSGTLFRKYTLYHTTTSLGYQRVYYIREYNGSNQSLPSIYFTYESSSSGISREGNDLTIYPGISYNSDRMVSGDFDGDGKVDVVTYNKSSRNKLNVFTNLFDYSNISIGTSVTTEKFDDVFAGTILSWNNKILQQQGITTVRETVTGTATNSEVRFRTFAMASYGPVFQYDKTVNMPIGPAGYFECDGQPSNNSYRKIPKTYVSGDFNGDGLTDVLAIPQRYYREVCEWDYDPWELYDECICGNESVSQPNSEVYFIDLKRTATTSAVNIGSLAYRIQSSSDRLYGLDFDGDGKTDLMHLRDGSVRVYSMNSSNQLVQIASYFSSNIDKDKPILLGDYNGDGKTDFTLPSNNNSTTWYFYLSRGSSFYYYSKNIGIKYEENYLHQGNRWVNGVYMSNPLYEFHFISQDYNGDGKTDILRHEVVSPWSSITLVSDRIQLYTNMNTSSETTPSFTLTTNSLATNNGLSKYGMPLFLEAKQSNSNLEYAYIVANDVYTYEFLKDHKKENTLKRISNNGVVSDIYYKYLDDTYGSSTYSFDYDEVYPYSNINVSPSMKVVKEVKHTASGHEQRQLFQYAGAVAHAEGFGYMGFKTVKKTNLYGTDVGTLWNISKYDMQKRGAPIQQWVSTSSSSTPYSYASKTDYTYSTQTLSNKVFINIPTQITREDGLQGITFTDNYTYDSFKNPTSLVTTYPGGSKTITYQYNNNSGSNSQYYHIGRPNRKTETTVINGNSFMEETIFGYSNNLVTQTQKRGSGTSWVFEYFQYDAFGNITQKSTSANGMSSRVQRMEYDNSGRYMTKDINVMGLEMTYTYNTSNGTLTSKTSAYGLTSNYTYDGWQRLLSITDYLGKQTNYAYNKENVPGIGMCFFQSIDYPEGRDVKTYQNNFGWTVQTNTLSLNGNWISKRFEHDVAGREIRESEPFFSTASPTQWNQVTYDVYGRPITHQLYTGRTINTSYSGLSSTVNDGVKTVTTTKDALGNVATMQDPGGTINYQYHGNGVMKSANYGSHVVSTTIDGWGRKTSVYDPAAGNYTYSYNDLGDITQETTPKGTTTFTYDSYGRISSKNVTGDHTNLSLSYVYNGTTKLLTNINGTDAINNRSYQYTYGYDSYKRINSSSEQIDNARFKKDITYDSFGRIYSEFYTTEKASSGINHVVRVKNSYDDAGILTHIRDYYSGIPLWIVEEENARGQSTKIRLQNGIVKNKTYDSYGYLTNITDKQDGSGGVQALKMDYSFNAQRGILNSRKNYAFTNWNETFTHDNLDRLTVISGPESRTKQYDTRGRITNNSWVGDYNYSSSNRYRLTSTDLNTQGDIYYQNHNLQNVTYNAFKKPVEIDEEDHGKVSFEYGPLMNRTRSYYGGEQTDKTQRRYLKQYSSITPVEIVEDNTTGVTKVITFIGGDAYGAPLAQIKRTGSSPLNQFHYLHRDYLGSILAISNGSAQIVEQRQFGAWGTADQFKNTVGIAEFGHDSLLDRGFTGHEHFFEVSLIHMNGRMYDANLGRFLSPDSYIQDPYNTQSFNRYGYVWNNPLVNVDPSGEFWFVVIGAIVGAYLGASLHQGSFNPGKWGKDWWKGAIVGAVLGAYGAQLLAVGPLSGTMFASGGISKGTVFAKALMASGKGMWKAYKKSIFSFDLDSGFKFDFSLNKEKFDKMLKGGALAAVGSLLDQGMDLLYKAGKNGAAATGVLAKKEWIGKLTRNFLGNTTKGIASNLINGEKGAFEDLTYLKFAGGLVEFGEGKKIINVKKIGKHAQGWALYGLAASAGGGEMPKFDLFNLNFNYKANSKFWTKRLKDWWKNKPKDEKYVFGIMVATMGGIVSTLGVTVEF